LLVSGLHQPVGCPYAGAIFLRRSHTSRDGVVTAGRNQAADVYWNQGAVKNEDWKKMQRTGVDQKGYIAAKSQQSKLDHVLHVKGHEY
jgi:hypothetical protein